MLDFAGQKVSYFPAGTITFPRQDDILSRRGRYVFPGKTTLVPGQDGKASPRRRYKFPEGTICRSRAFPRQDDICFRPGRYAPYEEPGANLASPRGRHGPASRAELPGEDDMGDPSDPDFLGRTILTGVRRHFRPRQCAGAERISSAGGRAEPSLLGRLLRVMATIAEGDATRAAWGGPRYMS